jgi:uncharacterized protein (DUF1800 family)
VNVVGNNKTLGFVGLPFQGPLRDGLRGRLGIRPPGRSAWSVVAFATLLAACGGTEEGSRVSRQSSNARNLNLEMSEAELARNLPRRSSGGTTQASPGTGVLIQDGVPMTDAVAAQPATSRTYQFPATRAEAARFLTQATFGATEDDVDQVMALGYAKWIDAQFNKPASGYRAEWERVDNARKAIDPKKGALQIGVANAFWKHAITGEDQLRQRVAFALSQIMVVSLRTDATTNHTRAATAYLDMLATHGLGSYRDLLEGVSLHPLMGAYLSHIRNMKGDVSTGRVPDENYAREVMQLFSLGVHALNVDGTTQMRNGLPVEVYTTADITGLAKVFTGFSLSCPTGIITGGNNSACWWGASAKDDPLASLFHTSMVGYAENHSSEEKRFLGKTIAAQGAPNPELSMKDALDTLAAHPNVGPFIGKQLIQRLVTSNPSPSYVTAVAGAFNNNGQGVRGDMKAVVKAILMHPEARQVSQTSGKVREPILRMTAYARAFPMQSDTGEYQFNFTDMLGQTPMHAPSVFNFYRPGYAAPGSQSAAAGLVAPELQITHESSVANYANYVRDSLRYGIVGGWNGAPFNRFDARGDHGPLLALAEKPNDMIELINTRLLASSMSSALKAELLSGIGTVPLPAATSTNQAEIDTAKNHRVHIALWLTMLSPEFQVQR